MRDETDMKLKVGVIGLGAIGQNHINAYQKIKDAEVVAICDVVPQILEATAKHLNLDKDKAFSDYRDLLKLKEVDAVSICTPPFLHSRMTLDAAAAGKHVLCEKPMAMNTREAREMVEACKKAGVKLALCWSRQKFSPVVDTAKEYITTGKLGKIYYARSSGFSFRRRPGIDVLVGSKWFLESSKAGGGALFDVGGYDLDLVLYLLGNPQPVSVSAMTFQGVGETKVDTTFDVEEHATLFIRFDNGCVLTLEKAWAANIQNTEGIMILGSKGGLKLNSPQIGGGYVSYYTEKDGNCVVSTLDVPPAFPPDVSINVVRDFVKSCLTNTRPRTTGEDGLLIMQIMEMAYLSAKLGREITLKESQEMQK